MCSCDSEPEPETTAHFHLIHILLYGSEKFNFSLNKKMIKLNICYLKDTERFGDSLI